MTIKNKEIEDFGISDELYDELEANYQRVLKKTVEKSTGGE